MPRLEEVNVIETKWIFKNNMVENSKITRNKARLVTQGYTQVEIIDFEETFVPVTRLESVRLLVAFSYARNFMLQQIDVTSAFLNVILEEEAYVEQPKGFVDSKHPQSCLQDEKAL